MRTARLPIASTSTAVSDPPTSPSAEEKEEEKELVLTRAGTVAIIR